MYGFGAGRLLRKTCGCLHAFRVTKARITSSRMRRGRLMVHGLLTATMPTKIGGDMNFIARELIFHFHRPVFAGDTIRCEVTLVEIELSDQYSRVKSKWTCHNQFGKKVMSGEASGVIRN